MSLRTDPIARFLQPNGDGGWTAAGADRPCVHPHPAHQGKAEPHLLTPMAPLATGPESQPYTFLPHPPQGRDACPPDIANDEVATEFLGGAGTGSPGASFGDTRKTLSNLGSLQHLHSEQGFKVGPLGRIYNWPVSFSLKSVGCILSHLFTGLGSPTGHTLTHNHRASCPMPQGLQPVFKFVLMLWDILESHLDEQCPE